MLATWLKLTLVCLSARGVTSFDAGGDVPGSPGNLADAMRGARFGPPSHSARLDTESEWVCLGADPAVVQQALKMLQNPMVMQQMKVMMQDPAVKQRMQKMLSKLGADSGVDPSLADPAMLDKLFERMQAPPTAAEAPRSTSACVRFRHTASTIAPAAAAAAPPSRVSAAPAPRAPPQPHLELHLELHLPPRAPPHTSRSHATRHAPKRPTACPMAAGPSDAREAGGAHEE